MKVVGCHKMAVMKIFKIPRGTTRRSLVKLKTWPLQLFWRWTPPLIFIRNHAKPFEQLFLGKRKGFRKGSLFLLIDWFYFSVKPFWSLERVFFDESFSVGPKHLALTAWKRYYSIVRIVSVRYVQAEVCNACLHGTLSTW